MLLYNINYFVRLFIFFTVYVVALICHHAFHIFFRKIEGFAGLPLPYKMISMDNQYDQLVELSFIFTYK